MPCAIWHLRAAICLVALAGCAQRPLMQPVQGQAVQPVAGHDFPQAAFAGFALDQTTPDQVQAALGAPFKQTTTSGIAKPDSKVIAPGTRFSLTNFLYVYAPNGNGQPRKIAFVLFFDGRLFSYSFLSSFPSDATPPVDEQRLLSLHQGKTTRAEAIALLGAPNGQRLNLLDNPKGNTQISYAWVNAQDGTVKLRTLNIFFDRSGRLSTYTLQDNSFPANSAPLQLPTPPKAPPPGDSIPPVPQYDLDHT